MDLNADFTPVKFGTIPGFRLLKNIDFTMRVSFIPRRYDAFDRCITG
jgi:hypothetical protein